MRDISARELKGHNILAVERFQDNTRWMIEFSVLRPSTAYGSPAAEHPPSSTDMRVFAQHIPCRKDWPLCLLRSLRSVPA